MDKIMEGTTVPNRQGAYAAFGKNTLTLYDQLVKDVRNGGDIDSIIDTYYYDFVSAIRNTIGSNNFVKN